MLSEKHIPGLEAAFRIFLEADQAQGRRLVFGLSWSWKSNPNFDGANSSRERERGGKRIRLVGHQIELPYEGANGFPFGLPRAWAMRHITTFQSRRWRFEKDDLHFQPAGLKGCDVLHQPQE